MTEQAICGAGYHRPETGMAFFRCVLPEGHEGPHDDGCGNKSMVVEKSSIEQIEREIKARLASGGKDK